MAAVVATAVRWRQDRVRGLSSWPHGHPVFFWGLLLPQARLSSSSLEVNSSAKPARTGA